MPEVDFIDTQIAQEDTRSLAQKARDCVLVGAVEGLFFTALLVALVIEGPVASRRPGGGVPGSGKARVVRETDGVWRGGLSQHGGGRR